MEPHVDFVHMNNIFSVLRLQRLQFCEDIPTQAQFVKIEGIQV